MVRIKDYKELYLIAWSIDRDNLSISEERAHALYQTNWWHVAVEVMTDREFSLLLRLVEQFGSLNVKFMGKLVEVVTLQKLQMLRECLVHKSLGRSRTGES